MPDPRFEALIEAALDDAVSVVNVGAGAGSYESAHRKIVAVEPSELMIRQRAADAAPAVVGTAESLPFLDGSVDAATAYLTLHHWSDQAKGLRELRRVARKRVVILTYVPSVVDASTRWLTSVYFPAIWTRALTMFPAPSLYEECLGRFDLVTVPVPADCTDGFLDAYWARPERYLEPEVRAGIFWLQELPTAVLDDGLRRLEQDLRDGTWDARFGHLRSQASFDVGLRLVVGHKTKRD